MSISVKPAALLTPIHAFSAREISLSTPPSVPAKSDSIKSTKPIVNNA